MRVSRVEMKGRGKMKRRSKMSKMFFLFDTKTKTIKNQIDLLEIFGTSSKYFVLIQKILDWFQKINLV